MVAEEIREFAVTVPAGTAITAPLVADISFPVREVVRIDWRIPPGPSGKMGWRLTSAGAPVIPIQPNTYIVTDNQAGEWPLAGYLDSGNWQLTAYNTGVFPHTVYLTFLLDIVGSVDASNQQLPPGGTGVIPGGGTVIPGGNPPGGGSGSTTPTDAEVAGIIMTVLAAMAVS